MMLGLIFGAVVVLIAALYIISLVMGSEPQEDERIINRAGRVELLCRKLTGVRSKDRQTLNQILSLGADVVPALLNEAGRLRQDGEDEYAYHLARIEEAVSDFGLAALPTILQTLSRLNPTAALAPSLLRILDQQGGSAGRILVKTALEVPALAPFLPHFSHCISDADVVRALRHRPLDDRQEDLTALAGILCRRTDTIDHVWNESHAQEREALLTWLIAWSPLTSRNHIILGLEDADEEVQIAAARLAALNPAFECLSHLRKVAQSSNARIRVEAISALTTRPHQQVCSDLAQGIEDEDAHVSAMALIGCLRQLNTPLLPAWAQASVVMNSALKEFFDGAWASLQEAPIDPLLEIMESGSHAERELAAHILALKAEADPRARERLIRFADGAEDEERVMAVVALARVGDATAADLLVRTVRTVTSPKLVEALQLAAGHIGNDLVPALGRRLRPDQPDRIKATMTILRGLDFEAAVPGLLHALEDARSSLLEGVIASTLAVGGHGVGKRIRMALQQPTHGLVVPALRYLASYGSPTDVRVMIGLFDGHAPLRTMILNLLECHGYAALMALEQRISEGGEDGILQLLEQRRDLLAECLSYENLEQS